MKNVIRPPSLLMILLVFLLSCQKEYFAKNTPARVKHKVKIFEPTCCPKGANVKEYLFQGHLVYVLDPGNCGADRVKEVLDNKGNRLGFLGGFCGNRFINDEDFGNATLIREIWNKPVGTD